MKHPYAPSPAARRVRQFLVCCALSLTLLGVPALHAQVPNLLNYQGRVAVGTTNFNGTGQFKFALVTGTTATPPTVWSNNGTSVSGSQPTAAVSLVVTNGLYSVLLGDTSIANMIAIPASVWANADVRLRIWFNDGTNGFQLLTPDQRIAPNGYLPDGSISAATISSGAITSAKIAAGAVTGTQLAANAVQLSNITNGAVDNTKLANSTVTVTAGAGLGGGGPVALGGSVALTNAGVTSLTGGGGITVNVATGTITLGSTATNLNTANAIVRRDASGNFSAGTITGTFSGNGAALTNLNAANVTGTLTPPANGFAVGGNQLVVAGSNVGVGTTAPHVAFEIYRDGPAGSTLRLSSSGNSGTKVGIDLATYDPVGIGQGYESPARIEAEDWNYSAHIRFQTKEPGSFSNTLKDRLVIRNDGVVSTPGGFIIENRTAAQGDPPAEAGRIWLVIP